MPFASDALGELMLLILCEPIPSLIQHERGLPQSVDDWWLRASARDPAQRFQSAKQLADALARALAIEPRLEIPEILPLGLRSRGVASVPDPAPSVASAVEPVVCADGAHRRSRRRPALRRWLARAGGAAMLVGATIAVISAAQDARAARRPPALLRQAAADLVALPKVTPAAERAVVMPEPAPKAPVRKLGPRPSLEAAPWPKPERPSFGEPSNACEREPAPAEAPEPREADEDVPDYGI
jgi:serine/threonine-protein kinase